AEIAAVAETMRRSASKGALEAAAEHFVGYWSGTAAWAASPPERRAFYAQCVPGVLDEFSAVLTGSDAPAVWCAALPARTSVVWSADTVRPSREIVEVLADAATDWDFVRVPEGGHMAPLTHAHLVNPIIGAHLLGP
ncbi:MAG: alpha/beta fold hydrolase, partial [Alphaproteobacteria bacterium]